MPMQSVSLSWFMFCLIIAGLLVEPSAAARTVGLASMQNFEDLPVIEEDVDVFQVSSHDRTGANDDGFNGTYSSLYRDEEGDYVLFDEIGAGCITRMWMTFSTANLNPTNHIRFYFDEDAEPRIDVSLQDFFHGTTAPFLSPLVGDRLVSSGGYYCYLPFPFARRCRIEMAHKPYFYNITCQRFASTNGVATWTGLEESAGVRSMWEHVGSDPKPTNGNVQVDGMLSIPAGTTGTVFSVLGAGAVAGLLLDIEPHSAEVLTNVWIDMVWDGEATPQVSAPLGEFFGCRFGETNLTALPVGMNTNTPYYCWFPMPFWSSAHIEVVNHSSVDITNLTFEVQYHNRAYDALRTGWFHAVARSKNIVQSDGNDYVLLETNGWGKVVGVVLSVRNRSTDPLGYLEGDERIYIDGSSTPQLYGTGTEDFFNGGWYFNQGPFSLPVHGNPMRKHEWRPDWNVPPYISNNFTAAYRFFLADCLSFRSSIRLGMEHGYNNSQKGEYSSVVYYYLLPSRTGMVLRTALDVGNIFSESDADYVSSESILVTNSWRYEGDADNDVVVDDGRIISDSSSFAVSLSSTNMGLLIRRRADAVPGRQHVKVYVDEALVSDWYTADCNFTNLNRRWFDAELQIPAAYTAGKTSVTVRLEKDLSSAGLWSEYRYWVYSLEPLLPTGDLDADGLPDEWEISYFDNILEAVPGEDGDGDAMGNLAEYIAGTDPLDSVSNFRLRTDAEALSFLAQTGRSYTLWYSSDLLAGEWSAAATNLQGNGVIVFWPYPKNGTNGFYRADVQLQW